MNEMNWTYDELEKEEARAIYWQKHWEEKEKDALKNAAECEDAEEARSWRQKAEGFRESKMYEEHSLELVQKKFFEYFGNF